MSATGAPSVLTRLGYNSDDLKAGLAQAANDVLQYKARATAAANDLRTARVALEQQFTSESISQSQRRLQQVQKELASIAAGTQKVGFERIKQLTQLAAQESSYLGQIQQEKSNITQLAAQYTQLRNSLASAQAAKQVFAAQNKALQPALPPSSPQGQAAILGGFTLAGAAQTILLGLIRRLAFSVVQKTGEIFQEATFGAAQEALRIRATSQKTGLSPSQLLQAEGAAAAAGVSPEVITTAARFLSRAISGGQDNAAEPDLAGAGTRGSKALSDLGIATTDKLTGKLRSTFEVMGDLADIFSKTQDGAAKTAVAVAVLGRSGSEAIPLLNGGRAAVDAFAKDAKDFDGLAGLADAETGLKSAQYRLHLAFLQLGIAAEPLIDFVTELTKAAAKSINEATGVTERRSYQDAYQTRNPSSELTPAGLAEAERIFRTAGGADFHNIYGGTQLPSNTDFGKALAYARQDRTFIPPIAASDAQGAANASYSAIAQYVGHLAGSGKNPEFVGLSADERESERQQTELDKKLQNAAHNAFGGNQKDRSNQTQESTEKIKEQAFARSELNKREEESILNARRERALIGLTPDEKDRANLGFFQTDLGKKKDQLSDADLELRRREREQRAAARTAASSTSGSPAQEKALAEEARLNEAIYNLQVKRNGIANEIDIKENSILDIYTKQAKSLEDARRAADAAVGIHNAGETFEQYTEAQKVAEGFAAPPLPYASSGLTTRGLGLSPSEQNRYDFATNRGNAVLGTGLVGEPAARAASTLAVAQGTGLPADISKAEQALQQYTDVLKQDRQAAFDTIASTNADAAAKREAVQIVNEDNAAIAANASAMNSLSPAVDGLNEVLSALHDALEGAKSVVLDFGGVIGNKNIVKGVEGLIDGFQSAKKDISGLETLTKNQGNPLGALKNAFQGTDNSGASLGSFAEKASGVLGALGAIGSVVGAVVGVFTAIQQKKVANIVQQITNQTNAILDAFKSQSQNLNATIAALQAEEASAIAQLSGQKGATAQLNSITQNLNSQIASLVAQQKQILDSFAQSILILQAGPANNTIITSMQQIAQALVQAANAGASATDQINFLALSLQQLQYQTQLSLNSEEQNTLSLLQSYIQLQQQKSNFLLQTTAQIRQLQLQVSLGRDYTSTQTAAQQIAVTQANAGLQEKQMNQQQQLLEAQLNGAAQLFGFNVQNLTTQQEQNEVLAAQVALQEQITAQTVAQIAAEQAAIAAIGGGVLPSTAIALFEAILSENNVVLPPGLQQLLLSLLSGVPTGSPTVTPGTLSSAEIQELMALDEQLAQATDPATIASIKAQIAALLESAGISVPTTPSPSGSGTGDNGGTPTNPVASVLSGLPTLGGISLTATPSIGTTGNTTNGGVTLINSPIVVEYSGPADPNDLAEALTGALVQVGRQQGLGLIG